MRKLLIALAMGALATVQAKAASVSFYGNVQQRTTCQQLAQMTQARFQAYRQTRAASSSYRTSTRTATTTLRVGITIGNPTVARMLSPTQSFRRDQMRLRRAMIRQGCIRVSLRQQSGAATPWVVGEAR